MRQSLFTVLLVSLCVHASAQSQTVRTLAPGVFYYFGDELRHRSANCVWIVFKDYVLAVDANYPWAAKEILQEIRKTTDKPVRFVLNTHYHHDHSFGNGVFEEAGATVVSSEATANEMKTLGKNEWDQNYSGQPLSGYTQTFPTLTFDSLLVFDDGQHRVELIRMGPAHTSGDVVAFLRNEKILITGDLFVNGNPWGNNVADPHADYEKWLAVLDTMGQWEVETVIPGHGEPATKQNLRWQRDYLADMLTEVKKGIAAGIKPEQLVKAIDLSGHSVYGKNTVSNARSIKAMYEKLNKK